MENIESTDIQKVKSNNSRQDKEEQEKSKELARLRTSLEDLGARQTEQLERAESRRHTASLEEQVLASQLMLSAMNLLARRDHSRNELEDKLNRKKQHLIELAFQKLEDKAGHSFSSSIDDKAGERAGLVQSQTDTEQSYISHFSACLSGVLARLEEERLLDDQRFSEGYIRWRVRSGFGPLRIKNELQQRGVDIDWKQLNSIAWDDELRAVREKKFGRALPSTMAEQAKQTRFLAYRGFPQDLIRKCLDSRRG